MAIPNVKLTVRHTATGDTTGKKNTEIFKANPDLFVDNVTSDTAVIIDTWARAFVGLSTDTYDDTEITMSYSVNEIIAEEG